MKQQDLNQEQVKHACNEWKYIHANADGLGTTSKRELKQAERFLDKALKISAKALGRKRK